MGTNEGTKISISKEAEEKMNEMIKQVNEGFNGGRVTKQDLVSWLIQYFEKNYFINSIKKIRQDHFDQLAYLDSIVKEAKKARKSGQSNADINTLLNSVAAPRQIYKPIATNTESELSHDKDKK